MNVLLPDWNIEVDLPVINQKKPTGIDHELVELLWKNGQVVLHSQTQRKPHNTQSEGRQNDQQQFNGSYGDASHVIQDAETISWIEYPLDNSFDRDFCSNYFSELSPSDPIEAVKPIRHTEDKPVKFIEAEAAPVAANSSQLKAGPSFMMNVPSVPMPPPRIQLHNSAQQSHNLGGISKGVNSSKVSAPLAKRHGEELGNLAQGEVECSFMTVRSSHCGSNQVQKDPESSWIWSTCIETARLSAGPSENGAPKMVENSERRKTETQEQTLASTSGGSGSSFGRACGQSVGGNSHKIKGRDAEEYEFQSENGKHEYAAGNEPAQRSGSSSRSRAAEVHNLSERRRRDRINEKMKTLKELIPNCNKTGRASMLDEAIEYLKALQLQLQVMWMGSEVAPMMFPGAYHYMSRIGMAMGSPQVPPMPDAMHFPRVPLVDHSIPVAPPTNQNIMPQTPIVNPVSYQNQMQNPAFQEQFAQILALHSLQTSPQPMNMFRYGPQMIPHPQTQDFLMEALSVKMQ